MVRFKLKLERLMEDFKEDEEEEEEGGEGNATFRYFLTSGAKLFSKLERGTVSHASSAEIMD